MYSLRALVIIIIEQEYQLKRFTALFSAALRESINQSGVLFSRAALRGGRTDDVDRVTCR